MNWNCVGPVRELEVRASKRKVDWFIFIFFVVLYHRFSSFVIVWVWNSIDQRDSTRWGRQTLSLAAGRESESLSLSLANLNAYCRSGPLAKHLQCKHVVHIVCGSENRQPLYMAAVCNRRRSVTGGGLQQAAANCLHSARPADRAANRIYTCSNGTFRSFAFSLPLVAPLAFVRRYLYTERLYMLVVPFGYRLDAAEASNLYSP